jgi:hypothetical protein
MMLSYGEGITVASQPPWRRTSLHSDWRTLSADLTKDAASLISRIPGPERYVATDEIPSEHAPKRYPTSVSHCC